MEFIVAPLATLRTQITRLFEEVVGATQNPFALGLTGGSTALIFLGALRDAAVDWSRVTLYWGDERAVSPHHPDSNYGVVDRLLLSPLGGRAPRAIRMPAEGPDLDEAARLYDAQLPPTLDLLILGMGDDGHVCSLFPGHAALQITDRRVAAVLNSPKAPPRRLTLTIPYIVASSNVWLVALGRRKVDVLQRAVARQTPTTPLGRVVDQAHMTVFTDQIVQRL